jgi:hypothetical protein
VNGYLHQHSLLSVASSPSSSNDSWQEMSDMSTAPAATHQSPPKQNGSSTSPHGQ